ncbi:MAG: PQQ-binding-like beta-propeller repeat protein, partial [Bacteroidia bacterium]
MKQFSFFLLLNVLGCTVFGQNMRILSMNHSDFTAKDNADGNGKFVVLSQYAQDNSHSAVISTFIKNDFSLAHSFELTHQNMGNEMAIALENANISAKKNPTPKNNYYILSHTQSGSFGSTDMVLTRLNENGKILWSKTIGSNGSDWGKIVVGTGNGALIGGQVSNGSTQQFYCFVDSAGVLKWSTLLNHSGSNGKIHPLGNSYYIGGNITENGFGKDDMMVAKLDKNGKPTWAKIIGSAAGEGCHRITGGNGNLYFGGVQTDGKKSVSVVKCDTTGKIIWKKKYGANQNNESMQVLSLINDTLYVLGKTTSFGAGGADLLALKIDQNGKLINHNAIGGTGQEFLTRSS